MIILKHQMLITITTKELFLKALHKVLQPNSINVKSFSVFHEKVPRRNISINNCFCQNSKTRRFYF